MTLTARVVGVLMLKADVFEDVEHDRHAERQALTIVILGSLAGSVGAGLNFGVLALLKDTLTAVVAWVMWAVATYFLGTRLWPEAETRTDLDELMRVIGFAFAPNLFLILEAIPIAGEWVRGVVALWILATTAIAVRQALDYRSTAHAFRVVLVGWLIFQVISIVLAT